MAIKVQFEIGHTSKLRSKKTLEGFTHDWELYVQGVDQSEISAFVDKVVFNLHDSFPKPKRACKDPPYVIQESGYAGFMLPIDIYFRNRDEPKRVQFTYDLDLQQTGPPHQRFEIRKFIFENPSEEFRQKLLKGGGVPVAGVVSVNIQDAAVNATNGAVLVGANAMEVSSGSAENVSGMINKPRMSSGDGKKHKSRNDDYKINTFANLFGTPIHKSKNSPDTKSSGGSLKNNNELVPSKSSNSLNGSIGKDKSYKEKTNAYAIAPVKNREKLEKKDIQKLSPRKDYHNENKKLTSNESAKSDSRNSDKNDQKEKQREKERSRDRKKFDNMSENSNSFKRSFSPQTFIDRALSPKHTSPQPRPSSASGRIEEQKKNKAGLSNKTELKSSSIGTINKKTKKYKKDKERDRDKRDINQRKTTEEDIRTKEEPNNSETNQNKFSPNANSREKDKEDKEKHASSSSAKSKTSNEKFLQKNSVAANATPTSVTSNSSSGDRKKDKKSSHKHKKKAKSKVQEKEKEQEKEKNIEKSKETKGASLNKIDETKTTTNQINKKLQSKDKNSKYKSSSKLEEKTKTKNSKSTQEISSNSITNTPTSTSINTPNNNRSNEQSETADSVQISHNVSDAQNVKTISGNHLSEESSNSSFPDIPIKRASKNIKNSPAKRPKLKQTAPSISETKPVKSESEKEDIKRRRPATNSNVSKPDGVSTESQHSFVEPPTKILKKEQAANSSIEPLKSPSTNNNANLSQTTTTPVSNSTTIANSSATPSESGALQLSAMVMPAEYLNELQELHQKIMTLQDNEELQQIVELIAATGCYEITAKTFDFDLCKLDRNTVQRLQEFLATSVC